MAFFADKESRKRTFDKTVENSDHGLLKRNFIHVDCYTYLYLYLYDDGLVKQRSL